jgi:nickel/cobalt transporter (NicO) family protein
MPDLSQIIQLGAAHAWFYLPVAVILGAFHALEPGHAKSLMAAYIVSIRGTPGQAVLLGLSAAVGHTIIVWVLAIAALLFGQNMIAEQAEPWLTMLSGVLVTLLAVRMFLRLPTGSRSHKHRRDHLHHHGHSHDHGHMDHGHIVHERQMKSGARAADIVWFGFSGGLLPCPAAIAVLLVCIQIKQFTLGVAMVAAFSVGLAATLVVVGLTASWMSNKASTAWPWLDRIAHRLPYLSAGIVMMLGLVMTAFGLQASWSVAQRRPD